MPRIIAILFLVVASASASAQVRFDSEAIAALAAVSMFRQAYSLPLDRVQICRIGGVLVVGEIGGAVVAVKRAGGVYRITDHRKLTTAELRQCGASAEALTQH